MVQAIGDKTTKKYNIQLTTKSPLILLLSMTTVTVSLPTLYLKIVSKTFHSAQSNNNNTETAYNVTEKKKREI